jgi:hypothetical protein
MADNETITSLSGSSSTSCLVNEKKLSVIHLLPCNIHHDGPAPIQNYFQTRQISKDQSSNKEYFVANFRGRRIEGLAVQLPENTVGCVVHTNRTDKQIEVHSTFDHLTVWEHDQIPSENVMDQSLEYFDMANIVSTTTLLLRCYAATAATAATAACVSVPCVCVYVYLSMCLVHVCLSVCLSVYVCHFTVILYSVMIHTMTRTVLFVNELCLSFKLQELSQLQICTNLIYLILLAQLSVYFLCCCFVDPLLMPAGRRKHLN